MISVHTYCTLLTSKTTPPPLGSCRSSPHTRSLRKDTSALRKSFDAGGQGSSIQWRISTASSLLLYWRAVSLFWLCDCLSVVGVCRDVNVLQGILLEDIPSTSPIPPPTRVHQFNLLLFYRRISLSSWLCACRTLFSTALHFLKKVYLLNDWTIDLFPTLYSKKVGICYFF